MYYIIYYRAHDNTGGRRPLYQFDNYMEAKRAFDEIIQHPENEVFAKYWNTKRGSLQLIETDKYAHKTIIDMESINL